MALYRFAVVAKSATTEELASLFCARLGELTGFRVVPRVVASYEDMVAELAQGRCELAWAPPFVALEAEDRAAATLLVIVRRPFAVGYHSALFVRADSPYRSLDDLVGVIVAWGSPWSASAYVVPRWHLRSRGIELGVAFRRELCLLRHEDIGRAVWERRADVGACHVGVDAVSGQLASAPWEATTQSLGAMRVLLLVGPLPADAIVALPVVPAEARRAAAAALLAMRPSDPAMDALFDASSFEPVPDGHLSLLRRLAAGVARLPATPPPASGSPPIA